MASAHHAAQQPRYSLPPPPNAHNEFRLPSLKDLNFQYRPPLQQEASPAPNSAGSVEHNSASQEHSPRHGQPWGRSNPPSSVPSVMPTQQHPHPQQTPPLSAGHELSAPKVEYTSKQDNGGYLTPGIPLSAQLTPVPGSVNIGPGTRGDDPHSHSKRVRTSSGSMTIPRDVRPSHPTAYPPQYASYPSSQPPPTSPFHQTAPGPPGPPPHNQMHHHPGAVPSHPGYAGYQQQYMQPRTHPVHPQHPSHPQQSPHGNPYPSAAPPPPPPQPQDPWEHHRQQQQQHHHQQQQQSQPQHPQPQHTQHPQHQPPPPPHAHVHPQQQHHQHQQQQHHLQQQQPHHPPQPHHQQMPFAPRTTALVPTNVDTRSTPYISSDMEKASSTMSEILKHCSVLYAFASRYAQLQASLPHVQPPPGELVEMTQRATQVVRLLEEFRRINLPEVERAKLDSAASLNSADDHRPPKRPWEDMSQDGAAGAELPAPYSDKPQSTAEQDMEIIRTKRATSAAGGTTATGQPKSKYRKRSRATPPGKCHSCNIRETPEWRRGPDGARTLCNACGLHYAKLMRKREKAHGSSGDAPRIDMDTLRASARAADLADKTHSRSSKQQASQPHHMSESTSPVDHAKQPPQHHQGSFQLVSMMTSGSNTSAPSEASPVQMQQPQQVMPPPSSGSMSVPPPPWATSAPPSLSGGRGYAPDQLQHQSFMRTSQHGKSNHTSPR